MNAYAPISSQTPPSGRESKSESRSGSPSDVEMTRGSPLADALAIDVREHFPPVVPRDDAPTSFITHVKRAFGAGVMLSASAIASCGWKAAQAEAEGDPHKRDGFAAIGAITGVFAIPGGAALYLLLLNLSRKCSQPVVPHPPNRLEQNRELLDWASKERIDGNWVSGYAHEDWESKGNLRDDIDPIMASYLVDDSVRLGAEETPVTYAIGTNDQWDLRTGALHRHPEHGWCLRVKVSEAERPLIAALHPVSEAVAESGDGVHAVLRASSLRASGSGIWIPEKLVHEMNRAARNA